ncbi:hypothetical protein M23134_00055 [Microscilla marina ATCC 23134]|uniref:Uncharacterized protein n=1 Tax=Microscilla marina ATCC 23134 TaxID=313606 RepID=A1ZKT6_MICM2|nr:hypothetical protein M23134_00055 [Microscilla marina ATCC 23134]
MISHNISIFFSKNFKRVNKSLQISIYLYHLYKNVKKSHFLK